MRALPTALAALAFVACVACVTVAERRAHAFGPRPRTDVDSTTYGLNAAHAFGGGGDESFLFGVAGSGSRFVESGALSFHGAHAVAIGLGDGLEGRFGVLLAWGTRLRVGETHGPVARAGTRFEVRGGGDGSFYALELPRAEVGWQAIADHLAIEAGLSAAPIVVGRRSWDETTRNLGGAFAYGAYAAAILSWLRVEGRWTRAHARETDTVDALACANVKWLSLCGDAALTFGAGETGRSWLGVVLGVKPAMPPQPPWD